MNSKSAKDALSSGAGSSAPIFSAVISPRDVTFLMESLEIEDPMRDFEQLWEERIAGMRENLLRAVRLEASRKHEAERRARVLEAQLAAMYTEVEALRVIAAALAIGYPVLLLVTR